MGFGDLPTIQQPQEYLDVAFQRARQNARKHTLEFHEKGALQREKTLALIKINSVTDYLMEKFNVLIAKYPDFDSLSEFYVQIIKSTISYNELKKSLGALQWYAHRVHAVGKQVGRQVKTATEPDHVGKHLSQYYGRVSSMMKQIEPELKFLHASRQVMRSYPSIKDEFTICIAGFPNVGKSTLLTKLTSATPEINNYAFTTKTLNVGYRELHAIKLQYLDTPGTLAREDVQNTVERQANLALRYVSNVIMYVFDITESCGYTITEQMKLFKNLKKMGKPMCAFLSKVDLLSEGDIQQFRTKYFEAKNIPLYDSIEQLDKLALKVYRDTYK